MATSSSIVTTVLLCFLICFLKESPVARAISLLSLLLVFALFYSFGGNYQLWRLFNRSSEAAHKNYKISWLSVRNTSLPKFRLNFARVTKNRRKVRFCVFFHDLKHLVAVISWRFRMMIKSAVNHRFQVLFSFQHVYSRSKIKFATFEKFAV